MIYFAYFVPQQSTQPPPVVVTYNGTQASNQTNVLYRKHQSLPTGENSQFPQRQVFGLSPKLKRASEESCSESGSGSGIVASPRLDRRKKPSVERRARRLANNLPDDSDMDDDEVDDDDEDGDDEEEEDDDDFDSSSSHEVGPFASGLE